MPFLLLIEECLFKLGGGVSLFMAVVCVFSLLCSYNMEEKENVFV